MRTIRTDISDYVIHFLRKQNENDVPDFYKNAYPKIREISQMDELGCLNNILVESGLRGSPSFRKGKSTVFGGEPVVCFTEMPLLNLLEYSLERKNKYKVSSFGLAIKKSDLFKNGGRPVIYGLSNDNEFIYADKVKRQLDNRVFPLKEQYRLVTLKMDGDQITDWTHEREWRIKCKEEDELYIDIDGFNKVAVPGINIFSSFLYSEIILIVEKQYEAIEIEERVRSYNESGYSAMGSEFDVNIKFLVLDDAVKYLKENHLSKIEDLPIHVYYEFKEDIIEDDKIEKIKNAIEYCQRSIVSFANDYLLNHGDTGICGWTYVACSSHNNPLLRYMVKNGIAESMGDFYYLKDVLSKIPAAQSLDYHEYIAKKAVDILNSQIEDIFYVRTYVD